MFILVQNACFLMKCDAVVQTILKTVKYQRASGITVAQKTGDSHMVRTWVTQEELEGEPLLLHVERS